MSASRSMSRVFGAANAGLGLGLGALVLRHWSSWAPALDALGLSLAAVLSIAGYGLLRSSPWRFHALRVAAWCGIGLSVGAALTLLAGAAGVPRGFGLPLELTVLVALALPYLTLCPMAELLWIDAQLQRSERLARKRDDASSEAYPPLEADPRTL
jgi:hypothetical protein